MTKVFITIDVETSIGGAFQDINLSPVGPKKRIWGEIKGKFYGIPLIMDILESFDLKGNFFVETFSSFYFGYQELKEICKSILKRGHDVQLHIHPNYQTFKHKDWKINVQNKKIFSDFLTDYTLKEQKAIIREGKKILNKCGINPVAFRAGSFNANLNTLKALKENSIPFDFSYNVSFLNKTCFLESLGKRNDAFKINSLIEIPVTNCLQIKSLRNFDVCALSFLEMKYLLDKFKLKRQKTITFVLHSFSFIKNRDIQYKKVTPNKIVIGRFKKLCNYLKENRSFFETSLIKDSKDLLTSKSLNHNFKDTFLKVPKIFLMLRLIEQIFQKF